MNREGFISIIALMLMTVVMVSCTYISYAVKIQSHIASNNQKKIQSRLISEDKINRLILDMDMIEELIIPEIHDIIRKKNPPYMENDSNKDGIPDGVSLPINGYPDLASNILSTDMRLQGSNDVFKMKPIPANFDETTTMILKIETEYEGIRNLTEVKGRVINKIFEIKEPYITEYQMISYDLVDEFNELMYVIEEEIFDYDPRASSVVKINLENNGYINEHNIIEILDSHESNYEYKGRHVLINIMSSDEKHPSWEIINQQNPEQKLFIKGNIYCEGDLIISSPLELEGNLILNKGKLIINSSTKPIIKGKVFDRAIEPIDVNKVKLNTEKKHIYRYGSYLPGFLDIQIDVIKR